jgi:hypothetical protein
MKDKQFEWKEQRGLLKQVIRVKYSYGNYSALLLPDERYVILDRTNSKFLLPSSGSLYTLLDDWNLWIKRGFIVVAFPTKFFHYKYYIFSAEDKRFIAQAKEIEARAFLEGRSDYFIIVDKHLGYTILDKNGKQITDWCDIIFTNGLVEGWSDYYIARQYGKYAIFYKDGHRITNWYDGGYMVGLVDGNSDYYVIEDNKELYIGKLGSSKLLGPFRSIVDIGFVNSPDENTVTFETSKGRYKKLTKQEVDKFFEEQELEHER